MKRTCSIIVFAFIANVTFSQASEEHLSKTFVGFMKDSLYHDAYSMFDSAVSKNLTEDYFKMTWQSVIKQLGTLNDYSFATEEEVNGMRITYTTCHFKNNTLDLKLVFNARKKIVGFFFVPPGTGGVKYSPPPYDSAKYTEHEIIVKTGEYSMPGILTVPVNVSNPPVIIFVHGSGPNDKDESMGPNKPFRDLAVGLAAKGIASIRYEKRTKVYGAHIAKNMHEATVQDETINDAISAVNMVGNLQGIDSNRIFVLGHSLGAMLAPRIANGSKRIKGIIMMAGNARLLEDVMIGQIKFLASLDTVDSTANTRVKPIIKQLETAKNPELNTATPDSLLPYNVSAPYWIDINHYNQVRTAEELKIPILVLQGKRDYQVSMKDYNIWKERLEKRKNVTMVLYPKLNHLFMEGEGLSIPAEYNKPNHIPVYVINDIASWVKKN